MKLRLDMVHQNPGEPPFQTRFLDPAPLAAYGFNGLFDEAQAAAVALYGEQWAV